MGLGEEAAFEAQSCQSVRTELDTKHKTSLKY